MNSWAKIMRTGRILGFEFWGLFGKMSLYRNGVLVASEVSFLEAKDIVLKAMLEADVINK